MHTLKNTQLSRNHLKGLCAQRLTDWSQWWRHTKHLWTKEKKNNECFFSFHVQIPIKVAHTKLCSCSHYADLCLYILGRRYLTTRRPTHPSLSRHRHRPRGRRCRAPPAVRQSSCWSESPHTRRAPLPEQSAQGRRGSAHPTTETTKLVQEKLLVRGSFLLYLCEMLPVELSGWIFDQRVVYSWLASASREPNPLLPPVYSGHDRAVIYTGVTASLQRSTHLLGFGQNGARWRTHGCPARCHGPPRPKDGGQHGGATVSERTGKPG